MDNRVYQTKYIILTFLTNSQVRIFTDGWVECRECALAEVNQLLGDLAKTGWNLVGSFDHKHIQGRPEAMDLYFRREKIVTEETSAN